MLTTLVMKTMMNLLLIDDDQKDIERLTKDLNTLKLAHETTLENH